MATVVGNNQVKLNSGKVIQAQEGGWYDGQQLFGGTLSAPGVINANSNQQGAGQAVSAEVNAQSAKAQGVDPKQFQTYIDTQRQQQPQVAGASTSQPAPTATPTGNAGGQGGAGLPTPPTINLPQLYEQLYAGSGIRDTEADLSAKTMAFNEQVSKIKNNPYLSEATMTGRIAKLEQKFNADNQALKNDIAMKKADVETQLNLQTKQFDIENEQVKLAWDQFNSLLSSGALDNASGEDIANLTRSTGISSSMIQSAIGLSREKNKPKVNTQVIQVDDGTSIKAVVINQDTGQIINEQVIGASKPEKPSASDTKEYEKEQNVQSLTQSIKNGITLKSLVNYYGNVLDIEEIYRLYNSYSPNGQAKEDIEDVKAGKFDY